MASRTAKSNSIFKSSEVLIYLSLEFFVENIEPRKSLLNLVQPFSFKKLKFEPEHNQVITKQYTLVAFWKHFIAILCLKNGPSSLITVETMFWRPSAKNFALNL